MADFKAFTEVGGAIRGGCMLFGILAVGLGAGAELYDSSDDVHLAFFWSAVVVLAAMVGFAVLSVVGFGENELVQKLDSGFYAGAGILMIVVSCFMCEKVDGSGGNEKGDMAISATAFGFIQGFIMLSFLRDFLPA